ncbi:hypothetical protein LTR66_009749 [Elasticomyces elasticus]|nr:hypothetical protein LTR66_009749 [Elasticomyces elasticus]
MSAPSITQRPQKSSRNLFAASLLRRPTTASTTASTVRMKSEVHEDPDDDDEGASNGEAEEGQGDIVRRDERGAFLLQMPALGEREMTQDEERGLQSRRLNDGDEFTIWLTGSFLLDKKDDEHLTSSIKEYWASCDDGGGRSRTHDDEDVTQLKAAVVARMREAVADKLEGERWMFEAQDPASSLR